MAPGLDQRKQLCAPAFLGTLRSMKRFLAFAFVGALLGGAWLSAPEVEARSCYSIWAEADGYAPNYRHFVYVENDCDYWIRCSAWTDVNPHPPQIISVAPGQTEKEETSARSEYSDPRGFGVCRQK